MSFNTLDVEHGDSFATIRIARPKALNALNRETREELGAAIDMLGADDSVRAIILTGSGTRAFSTGADITELQALESAASGAEQARHMDSVLRRMNELPKPIIMAVNGYALGGGCELALAGDIVLAADTAQFGLPEVGLGLIPGFGGTQRLPRAIGRGPALALILTGARLSAAEALQYGLVSKVVPAQELLPAAREVAAAIAEKAPLAVALAKRAVYEGLQVSLDAGIALEAAYFGVALDTQDCREGISAFLDKRTPRWEGH